MLRSMSMNNFIHFIKSQKLYFEKGVNIIIAGISTGKTAVFELIRRCLSNSFSTSISSISQKDKLAYTICFFKTPSDKMPPWIVDDSISFPPEALLACLLVPPVTTPDRVSFYYKILFTMIDNKKYKTFGQRYQWSGNSSNIENLHSPRCFVRETCNTANDFLSKICRDNLNPIEEETEPDNEDVISLFQDLESWTFSDNTILNKHIKKMFEWLTGAYVGVFPMRSIGPLQWTRSKLINPLNREDNYRRASSQAKILMDLLDGANQNNIDWDIADCYRKHLVYHYSFRKLDNQILVHNKDTGKDRIPLLKIPEGVVEAEQTILLLSDKRNLTLSLEEPDRGMHPFMINRLRNWVLKRVVNKTVLVISHHPSMLDHCTIDRTYLCSKSKEGRVVSQDVQKLPKEYRRYGSVEEMKCLLFSESVLFVEGYTDQIIIEALLDVVINGDQQLPESIAGQLEEKYKEFLSSLHVVELEGKGTGPTKMRFCNEIKRNNFVIYDFDLVLKKIDNKKNQNKCTLRLQHKL